jgi:DNA-binding transcriptional MocR family regulator
MEGETCQITVEPGITISASRTTSRDIRRHKATAQQVVAQLTINPNTVHKAYRELEREGLVRARPGLGTFVTRAPSGPDPATQAGPVPRRDDRLAPLGARGGPGPR